MRTVTVAGSNLYRVAANELGDALQWWRIAELNGLSDPQLSGLNTLLIPDRNATLSDGLPPSGAFNVNQ